MNERQYTSRGETYRIAILRGPEIRVVSPLLCEVFGSRRFTPDWLERKFAYERGDVGSFLCAAFARDGTPAAAVGLVPWPIRYGDRVELAGQLADSATSPAHRGRGLHVRLVRLIHELCDAAGMTFVFRFSNDLSFAITTSKLGYVPLVDLAEYRRPVRTLWLERAARRAWLGDAFERRFLRVIEPHVAREPALPSSVLAEGYAGVEREPDFLAYKAAFEGAHVLNLEGARAWVEARHGLLVGDMTAESDEAFASALAELDRIARRLGAHRLLFQASEDVLLARRLARRLPETLRRRVSLFDLSSKIPLDALRFTMGDIDTF